jgi:hypothetical protein
VGQRAAGWPGARLAEDLRVERPEARAVQQAGVAPERAPGDCW